MNGQTDADGAVLLSVSPHLSQRCATLANSYRTVSSLARQTFSVCTVRSTVAQAKRAGAMARWNGFNYLDDCTWGIDGVASLFVQW